MTGTIGDYRLLSGSIGKTTERRAQRGICLFLGFAVYRLQAPIFGGIFDGISNSAFAMRFSYRQMLELVLTVFLR